MTETNKMTQIGKKHLMKRVRHKAVVSGSKRPRTVPIRKSKLRSTMHIMTVNEGRKSYAKRKGYI